MWRCNENKLYKKGGCGGGEHETLSTNEIKELEFAELISHSTYKCSEQPMCACDNQNYYFIKELLQLAAALWPCCEEAVGGEFDRTMGTAAAVRIWEGRKGRGCGGGGGHASIWVISQSAREWVALRPPPPSPSHLKTRVLHCVFTWINCPNYVCSTHPQRKNKRQIKSEPMKKWAVGHVPFFWVGGLGLGGTCHHERSITNCFKW